MTTAPHPPGNLLLSRLEPQDRDLLEPHLLRVSLSQGDVVVSAGQPLERLVFPEGGVLSVHDLLADGSRVGIGIIGREGLAGWQALLGCQLPQHEITVAIAGGDGLAIGAEALLDACRRSPSLNALLLRFVASLVVQMGRTIVSNLTDPAERRLARWLVMNHDRIAGDEIDLTHSQIGVMLGVRRATVTDTLHLLEGQALIRSTRGRIAIRDRAGLQRLAGESYGVAEAEYDRLCGPWWRDARVG